MNKAFECNNDWTPCSKLPKSSTTMKVWMSFYNKTQNGNFSYVKSGRWYYDHFEYENGKRVPDDILVAWMPYYTPKPYKKIIQGKKNKKICEEENI